MLRHVMVFSVLVISVVTGATMTGNVSLLTRLVNWATAPDVEQVEYAAEARPSAPVSRQVTLEATPDGHFLGSFRINGRTFNALVDTGATVVAMNVSTAKRAGIRLLPTDFNREVQTANGRTRAALAKINRIEIGRISVDNVEALVLDDHALQNVLVGMSFLNRLKRYEAANQRLLLVQ